MGVEGLGEHPLGGSPLPVARRDVFADAVTEDVIGSLVAGDMAASLANDEHQFDLVVDRDRGPGDLDRGVRRMNGVRLLAEPHLVLRTLEAGLGDRSEQFNVGE